MRRTSRTSRFSILQWGARILLGALLAAVFAPAGRFPARAQVVAPAPLRLADQVRRLTPEQAEQHLEVRIKGVVTFSDERLYSRFVQDETAGIYLNELTNGPALVPGQLVEIEGQTGAGEYA